MKRSRCRVSRFRIGMAAVFVLLLFLGTDAAATFFEKHYAVKPVRGEDVLCDPYVVQKDDWVLRLFRQRGEIAREDFPMFLEIFEILNPDVDNINKIYPGQKILIPLRILPAGTFEGQESGSVSLPVITITRLPEIAEAYSTPHKVRYGEWVSKLIARSFGEVGSEAHEKGMELFAHFNPEIENIDWIIAGQTVRLPDPEIIQSPVYAELFEEKEPPPPDMPDFPRSASEEEAAEPEEEAAPEKQAVDTSSTLPSLTLPLVDRIRGFSDMSIFGKAAAMLDGDVVNSGEYYFPRDGQSDLRLTLSETPLMVFEDGTTLLFTKKEWLPDENRKVIERYRPDINIVFFEADMRLGTLVSTIVPIIDKGRGYERHLDVNRGGISVAIRGQYIYEPPARPWKICLSILEKPEMRVPDPVRDFFGDMGVVVRDWVEGENLSGWAKTGGASGYRIPESGRIPADPPEQFVAGLFRALGYRYQPDVNVSFPYAGFQVSAYADLLSMKSGGDILIDYGDLGGDAITSIEKTGLQVLQLKRSRHFGDMISQLAEHRLLEYDADPIFWTSARPRLYNPSIQIPGYLVTSRQEAVRPQEMDADPFRLLVSVVPLPDPLAAFLGQSGIRAVEADGLVRP
ncbi:MAG: hypothetical protein R6T92_03240 [Desulfosalsimonadaceae bacterium]